MPERVTAPTDVDRVLSELVLFGRRARQFGGAVAQACGLQATQVYVLSLVDRASECRLSAIAEQQLVDPSVISRQIATLEREGLLSRRPDPDDRRAALVSLTAQGQERLRQVRSTHRTLVTEILRDWPAEQVARFADDFSLLMTAAETVYGRLAATNHRTTPVLQQKDDA